MGVRDCLAVAVTAVIGVWLYVLLIQLFWPANVHLQPLDKQFMQYGWVYDAHWKRIYVGPIPKVKWNPVYDSSCEMALSVSDEKDGPFRDVAMAPCSVGEMTVPQRAEFERLQATTWGK